MSRKRRRLEENDVDEYITNVDNGTREGIFGANVCTEDLYPDDPEYKKFRERHEFEIQPLLMKIGDQQLETGWARCTLSICQERRLSNAKGRVFRIQQKNRDGVLKRDIIRHFTQFHLTEEEEKEKKEAERLRRIAGRRRLPADSAQPSMELFAQPVLKKLTPQIAEELKKMNAAIIAEEGLSLDFFKKDAVIERERFLLKSVGYDPDEVHRFDRGKNAVKDDIYKEGSKNARIIRSVAPQLADKSRLSIMIDHQSILQLSNEETRDALGIGLILSSVDDKRYSYLLSYEATETTAANETVRVARRVAQERE